MQQNKEVVAQKNIPLINFEAQHLAMRDELLAAFARVLESHQFVLGTEVERLEEELATYAGAVHGIACASGTDALALAMMALDIQPGDEVLTVPFTFFATAGSISRLGARPVFTDIEAGTFNMDMNRVEAALGAHSAVRAVIPVHLFGGCADVSPLLALARTRGIAIIEDAAQAIGAEYGGRRAGSLGHVACFSFYPSKNLGALGDAGMLTTSDASVAKRLRSLRVHGSTGPYVHEWIGINSRMDALQAAALRVKFRYLDAWTKRRQENAERYRRLIAEMNVPVSAPALAPYQTRHVYHQFVIRAPERDRLQRHLAEQGIGTAIYYPLPLHLQECFASLGYRKGDFPESERAAGEVLALPVGPEVTSEEIEYVCGAMRSFYGRG